MKIKRALMSISLRRIAVILILLVLIILPLTIQLGNYILALAITTFIYLILSESWNLMGGYAGQVNFGFAAYFGTGVLTYSLMSTTGVPFYIAILTAGFGGLFIACVVGPPTLRLRGAYFGIGTLAVAEVLRLIVSTTFPGVRYAPPAYMAAYSIIKSYYIALAIAVFTVAGAYLIVNSRIGLTLQAIRDDEDAANASGINPAKYKMLVFIISAFPAGLAGGALGYYLGAIIPPAQFSAQWTIGPLVAATIGGWGTLIGPALGSIVYVLLQEVLGRYVREAYLIITGLVFILVIIFLPKGLIQSGRMIRVFIASIFKKSKSLP